MYEVRPCKSGARVPPTFVTLHRMNRADFEKLVEEGFALLPEHVREKIRNVAVLVEDEPSREDREAQGLMEDETLLGLYKGIPLSERGEQYGVGVTMPDTITIYQKPIEEAAEDTGLPISVIVADTVMHEFAHHFGMNEAEVYAWEKSKGIGHARE